MRESLPAVRRVLRSLLEEVGGWQVVGEADSGEAAVDMAEQLVPDERVRGQPQPVPRAEGSRPSRSSAR